jgi:hypothetical protein
MIGLVQVAWAMGEKVSGWHGNSTL